MARIVVLGGGFAGLWAALAAARKRAEFGTAHQDAEILLIDRHPYHSIRVRNYEADLSDAVIPLGDLLDPVNVAHHVAEVESIDAGQRTVTISRGEGRTEVTYDRLVLALGSELSRPQIPGLHEYSFNVDTYDAALRLRDHLGQVARQRGPAEEITVIVGGGGFTGIEVAAEMPRHLAAAGAAGKTRVILTDPNKAVGSTIGDHARPVIMEALDAAGVELRLGVRVTAVDETRVTFSSGESLPCDALVWCAGIRPPRLIAELGGVHDRLGRLKTDSCLRAEGLPHAFVAGDCASTVIDGEHESVMSCQFARPMGRYAGHNAMADLAGAPLLPLHVATYVTVLDLGDWGALYTEGWDRVVKSTGAEAKRTKMTINHQRIYPPLTRLAADLLAAAAPVIQAPPALKP